VPHLPRIARLPQHPGNRLAHLAVRIVLGLPFLFAQAMAAQPDSDWLRLFSRDLRLIDASRISVERKLEALGIPVVGQTADRFGYQHPRRDAPPLVPPWVQVDFQSVRTLDWIALVPAQVDWQTIERPAYGFPPRFRIDLSNDPEFRTFQTLADFTDTDLPDPGIAPVTIRTNSSEGRYLRVTVTKLAIENAQHFFALAEIMAISGRRNVATGRPVKASASTDIPPRWHQQNLVDGLTPLGPPIRRELIPYDGLYAGMNPEDEPTMMRIDLGREFLLDEVRLHPVHARIGADIPGFLFPQRFRVEASRDATMAGAIPLLDSWEKPHPNPGNNPITLLAEGVTARFIKIINRGAEAGKSPRFGLSEVEVYSQGENVARSAHVEHSPDLSTTSRDWPASLLVDGFTSYGRLIELPDWLATWDERRLLRGQLAALDRQRDSARSRATDSIAHIGMAAAVLLVLLAAGWNWRGQRRRQRELEALRLRLARDLHDEIGSNLAGIAVVSELAASRPGASEDWQEVHQITRETIDSIREVLWVLGAREDGVPDLLARLQRIAARWLPAQEIRWLQWPSELPREWSADTRRQIFLVFKEALTNVSRHASARLVEIRLHAEPHRFLLEVRDDGHGFEPASVNEGVGLGSLRERARHLRGKLSIRSTPGKGTHLILEASPRR
jgi:signal transduction histidine kinase